MLKQLMDQPRYTSFLCSIDRIRRPLNASGQMYLINHDLDGDRLGVLISDRSDAPTATSSTNCVSSCVNSPYFHILLGRVT